ncbi:MAG: homocysteine methyltransferase [Opitutales bacterium]|nr:homocysteine methyltransferase [Opitutales bacterium]|tara:strand:- start:407 stop:1300 length:894 start_codon:yes stop_codon:yes gene_type:complete
MSKLLEALKERVLLGDGGMGTQLMQAGLEAGACGEAWNVERPDQVLEIQRRYARVGSDCIITNTFGGCSIMLSRHGQENNTVEINKAAVGIAREAFEGREGFVLGDVGPFGGLMQPYGEVEEKVVQEAFAEQIKALVDAGADAIIVETQTALEELGLGIEAAKEAGAPCIIGSMAYDVTSDGSNFRTMMGVDPEQAAEFMMEQEVDVIALNCGTGMNMERAREGIERYRAICDLPVMTQPNAGLPVLEDLKVVYKQPPEEMVAGLPALLDAGANVVGACCGSAPEHIAAFRKALDER